MNKFSILIIVVMIFSFSTAVMAVDFNAMQSKITDIINSREGFVYPYKQKIEFNVKEDYKKMFTELGSPLTPKALRVEGKIVKYIVPCVLKNNNAGGFFQFDPQGNLIALPDLAKNNQPYFSFSADKWESIKFADELEELSELIPPKLGFSAGAPVEPSKLKNAYLVKGAIDELPFKSQEERKAWIESSNLTGIDGAPLKYHAGRRTGSSKCLSYATSSVADYWTIATGNKLDSYENFISGIIEYGHDPRLIENIYYKYSEKFPKRFWMAPFGKDRVTGEKIPWSIKAYVEVLFNAKDMKISDRLKNDIVWDIDKNGFHMDITPVRVFKGISANKTEKLKIALKKFGPLLAQHTTRFANNIPNPILAAHAVMIVGHCKINGKDMFIYHESFGDNGANYLEDSLGGPRYRVMPAKLFFQAWGFPHTLRAEIKLDQGNISIETASHENKSIPVDSVVAVHNNKTFKAQRNSETNWTLPAKNLKRFNLFIAREHFIPLMLEVNVEGDNILVRPVDTSKKFLKGFHKLESVFK